jgi:hypothetical protein
MQTKSFVKFLSLAVLLFTLAACTMPANTPQDAPSPTPPETGATLTPGTPTGNTVSGLALVETIDVLIMESFPVQVQVIARGALPDGCTTIDQAVSEREGNEFRVTITTVRPADAICTEALVPFEEAVRLDVLNLPSGTYTVDVNGITGSFELEIDNIAPTPEATASSGGDAAIAGVVWHDLCAVSGGEGDVPLVPSSGCVELEDGSFRANGILEEEEPRLAGIEVTLGQGACPAAGFATTKTNPQGEYTFSNLGAGQYCVSVNAESLNNGPILIPGKWSAPQGDAAQFEVVLEAGEDKRGLFFGWDFELLPEPGEVQDETSCTNQVAFEDDITLPDDSQVPGGQPFEKIWELRNSGTCTWTTGYSLVFAAGEQMGAASPIGLNQEVPPGETTQFSITFTAPASAGTYRSEWLIRSAFGQEFGTGRDYETPFWVQVQVVESAADLNLGEPTWRETFDNSARWFLVNSNNTLFTIENGEMVMRSASPGSFDEWGLSNYQSISDFIWKPRCALVITAAARIDMACCCGHPIQTRGMFTASPVMGATACMPGMAATISGSRNGPPAAALKVVQTRPMSSASIWLATPSSCTPTAACSPSWKTPRSAKGSLACLLQPVLHQTLPPT